MEPKLHSGTIVLTDSGSISFCNECDLSSVVRMYELSFRRKGEIKAWQVHSLESKWMRCTQGKLLVKVTHIKSKEIQNFILDSSEFKWLYIPAGYANGIQPLENDSVLLVGSDLPLEKAEKDNLKWPIEAVQTDWNK